MRRKKRKTIWDKADDNFAIGLVLFLACLLCYLFVGMILGALLAG